MYSDVSVKILAVWYRGEFAEESMEFEVLLAKMFFRVERNLEAKASAMKTRSPIEVLVGDPQSIR